MEQQRQPHMLVMLVLKDERGMEKRVERKRKGQEGSMRE